MRSRDIHKIVGILFDKGEVTLAQTLAREVTSTLLPDLNIGIRPDKVEKAKKLLQKGIGVGLEGYLVFPDKTGLNKGGKSAPRLAIRRRNIKEFAELLPKRK